MRVLLLIFYLFVTNIYALSLDELITKALEKNPSLESISGRIEANKHAQDISNQFPNPVISFSTDTLDAQEKMHKQSLTLQQRIPFYGKRDAQENISIAEGGVLEISLSGAKVRLVNELKNQAYNIWELEQLLSIITQYENLTKQNIELSESYTSTSQNQHMGIMSAQLSLTDLKIQKSVLTSKVFTAYTKLSYLAGFEIQKIDIDISVNKLPSSWELKQGLVNNQDVAKKDKEIGRNQAMIDAAELNNYPDINLVGGYSYRQNFDDYFTFGLALSLPIYGTEDSKEQEQRTFILVTESQKKDISLKVNSEFMSVYMQMKSQYEIYHIIHDDALPQIEHMFDLSSSSIATGGDLFKYIDILKQKLKLEQKIIASITNYNRANAKISALMGELK